MVKPEIITFTDKNNCLSDRFGSQSKPALTMDVGGRIKGRFKIYERKIGDKNFYLVEEKNNLIVYHGRNWLMQRAFNQDLNDSDFANRSKMFISWLSIGTGGALEGNPLSPVAPTLPDCKMGNHGLIASGERYLTIGEGENARDFHAFDEGYPIFLHDPEVDNSELCTEYQHVDPEEDISYNADKFLIAKIVTTIASDEANVTKGRPDLEYQDINEAALWVSPSKSLSYDFSPEDMQIFARVTFSTIRKDVNRALMLVWYIYF